MLDRTRTAELAIMSLVSTILAVAVCQFTAPTCPPGQPCPTPNPSGPPCSWIWTQLPNGSVNWAWGWQDTAGYFHAAPKPDIPDNEAGGLVGAIDPKTGAIDYGVSTDAIKGDGTGTTVRASSAMAEATAREIAESGEPDFPDVERYRRDPFGIGAEVRRLLVYAFAGLAVLLAIYIVWGKK